MKQKSNALHLGGGEEEGEEHVPVTNWSTTATTATATATTVGEIND